LWKRHSTRGRNRQGPAWIKFFTDVNLSDPIS
jgi:hypothetical protein